jgi:hypothetical protein
MMHPSDIILFTVIVVCFLAGFIFGGAMATSFCDPAPAPAPCAGPTIEV